MLDFVVVGYGDRAENESMIRYIQNYFNEYFSKITIRTYNLRTLWKAESNASFLKRKQSLLFPTSDVTSEEYLGAIEPVDYQKIYSRWFSDNKDSTVNRDKMYYSQENLSLLMSNLYIENASQHNNFPYDYQIHYRFGNTNVSKTFCIIKWCICNNETLNYENYIKIFQQLIAFLDDSHHNVFISAYISKSETNSKPITSLLDRYDSDLLGSNIFSPEYSFYISDIIDQGDITPTRLKEANYSATRYLNGVQYTYNYSLCDFDRQAYDTIYSVFYDKIIPSYGVFNWSYLCNLRKQCVVKPEKISIYYDVYSPTDPTIVFSSKISDQQLDCLPMLFDLTIKERYSFYDLWRRYS